MKSSDHNRAMWLPLAVTLSLTVPSVACNSTGTAQQLQTNVFRPRPALVFDTISGDSVPDVRDLENEMFSPNTLIIHYDSQIGNAQLLKDVRDYGAEIIYNYRNINAIAIRIPDGVDIHTAISHFSEVEGVLQVNRDRKLQLMNHRLP